MIASASAPIDFRPRTRAERFRAIRAISFREETPLRVRTQLRRLVEQLEANSSDESGTGARQEVLAAKLGISVRTFQRWFAAAVAEGLVRFDDSWTYLGRKRRMTIRWQRVLAGPINDPPRSFDGPRRLEEQVFFDFADVASRQNDASHHDKMAGCNREEVFSSGHSLPPAPQPPAEPADVAPAIDQREEWEGLRELLKARGVQAVNRMLDRLQRRGVEPWAVQAVIRFWDVYRSRWRGPGALWNRLYELDQAEIPETDPESRWDEVVRLWPRMNGSGRPEPRRGTCAAREPSRVAAAPQSVRSSETAAAERVDREERARQWARQEARVERDYGSWFDSLGDAQREQLLAELLDPLSLARWHAERDRAKRRHLRTLALLELERRAMAQEVRA